MVQPVFDEWQGPVTNCLARCCCRPDTIAVLAGMPALQQLALTPTVPPEPFPHPDAPPTDVRARERCLLH